MSHTISLKLFASLAKRAPENADAFPVAPGATVLELVRQLNIPLKEAKLVFINNRRVELDTVIQDGDRVGIFPPVGGG